MILVYVLYYSVHGRRYFVYLIRYLNFVRHNKKRSVDMRWSGVSLTLCCFVVYSTRRFVILSCLVLFCSCVFSPFSIAITSLGEERANQCFLYVCSICACLVLSVSASSWCLGRAAACDCPQTFLLLFFMNMLLMLASQDSLYANECIFRYIARTHCIKCDLLLLFFFLLLLFLSRFSNQIAHLKGIFIF